ncbi:MAG: ribosome biogenesis GTPase YlqF [Desulfuromonadales bacterium]
MAIKWYPGHMNKARRLISETMRTIDVVIEVLDARLPASSANPLLAELRGNKPCIKLLNKADLADPEVTRQWGLFFERQHGVKAIALEAKSRSSVPRLLKLIRSLAPHRGVPGKPLRVMVVGIPNVGKSTLINTLAGRAIAKVGDKPAITKSQQHIDLKNGIVLSDTPGILWPNLADQDGAYRLAASGAIGDTVMEYPEVALFVLDYLARRYPEGLKTRYRLSELPPTPSDMLQEIGRRRGCLVAGGEVDRHRAAEILLFELRGGKIGRVSLETPDELKAAEDDGGESGEPPEDVIPG